jgi:hypothetical protein
MMATRVEACAFGELKHQQWAGELHYGEGSCVRSLGDLKRIVEAMHPQPSPDRLALPDVAVTREML